MIPPWPRSTTLRGPPASRPPRSRASCRMRPSWRPRRLLVTVPDISRPLFSLILQGIEETAHGEGYAVLLGDTQYDQGREERYAQMLPAKGGDGLILLC